MASASQATKRMALLVAIMVVLLALSRSLPPLLGVPGSLQDVLRKGLQLVALFAGVIAAWALGRRIPDDGCGRIIRSMRSQPSSRMVALAAAVALYVLVNRVPKAFPEMSAVALDALSCLGTLIVSVCVFLVAVSQQKARRAC